MSLVVTVALFLLMFGLAGRAKKLIKMNFCPLCVGESSSWLVLTFLVLSGVLVKEDYLLPLAMIMGGSVVGIVYRLDESRMIRSVGWPKALITGGGFVLVYLALIYLSWPVLIVETLFMAILAYYLFYRKPGESEGTSNKNIEALEKRMKSCC